MEQTTADALHAQLWAESEHTNVVAKLLYEQKVLLDLPQATFDATWPALGGNAVSMVAEGLIEPEFSNRDEASHANLFHEYEEDLANLGGEMLHARIYRFSTMPTAWEKAVEYLVEHFNANIIAQCCKALSGDGGEKKIIEMADRRLLDIVVTRARASMEQGLEWSPAHGIATINRVCPDDPNAAYIWHHYERVRMTADVHTFERTHELLRQMHSREVGEMLAEKVAGHKFPPELVEPIADCFYDKALLLSFKLGRHGINGS